MNGRTHPPWIYVAVIGALCGGASTGRADIVTFNFSHVFSGDVAITGTVDPVTGIEKPWLTATFEDVDGQAGTVKVTLTNNLDPASGEYVDGSGGGGGFYFNIKDDYDVSSLVYDDTLVAPVKDQTLDAFEFARDGFKADGDGLYDLNIKFGAAGGAQSPRLEAGETAIFTITGTSGPSGKLLDAAAFTTLSTPDGGHGPFLAAAHIQGTSGPAGSSWVDAGDGGSTPSGDPVPEPGTIFLLGSGLLGLSWIGKKKFLQP